MLFRAMLIGILIGGLSACGQGPNGLRPVNPTLDAEAVVQTTSDRQRIMAALQRDADFGRVAGSASWYEITLSGFNFVDDQCSAYFDSLFRLERDRRATVSGLGAFGQTANAILAASGESELTLTVVAQVFGLGRSITEIVADSFLFQLPPATTRDFVSTTQAAYRSGIASEASSINNPSIAYSYIRGYLDLCLPVTIEGMLVDTISSTQATPGEAAGGQVGIELSTATTPAVTSSFEQPQDTRTPLPAPTGPRVARAALDTLSPANISAIQVYLCFEGSAVDGRLGPNTRIAMADYFAGLGETIEDNLITLEQLNRLTSGITGFASGSVASCAERGVQNARQVGQSA